MHRETAGALAGLIEEAVKETEAGEVFIGDASERHPLDAEGFRSVPPGGGVRCAFVDGGSQELIGAPNLSVQLHRVAAACWQGPSRVSLSALKCEFYSLAEAVFDRGDLSFRTHLVPAVPGGAGDLPDPADLLIRSRDPAICEGTRRAAIAKSADVIRKFAEWRTATAMVEKLNAGDALVMDGSLQTAYTNEQRYCHRLSLLASERGVIVSGLSKSSALFTTTGLPLITAIERMAIDHGIAGPWYYPVAALHGKGQNVMLYAVHLHTAADRPFRFEVRFDPTEGLDEGKVERVIAGLAANAGDAGFPGYPYGLIDADRTARVRFDELAYYRDCLLAQLVDRNIHRSLSGCLRAGNAHDILNRMIG
ncbi:MAG: DNA double-strand break repair nuclease NurA [Methanospirillum sp.]